MDPCGPLCALHLAGSLGLGWKEGLRDRWMDRWVNGWMEGWMDGQMDGWIDGQMDGWMDVRWMDGWMGQHCEEKLHREKWSLHRDPG